MDSFKKPFLDSFQFIPLHDHCIEMIGGKIEDGDLEGNLEAEQNIGIDGEGAPTAYCRVFYFYISESHYYSFLFVESMLQPGTFC